MSNFKEINELRFWCQKVLPLVYDDSLSYYELLCKVVNKLNEVIDNVDAIPNYIREIIDLSHIGPIISGMLDELREQIANANEKESRTATAPRSAGELVWLDGKIYRVIHDMIAGDQYFLGSNIEKVTIESVIKDTTIYYKSLEDKIDAVDVKVDDVDDKYDIRINVLENKYDDEVDRLNNRIGLEINDRIAGDKLRAYKIFNSVEDMCADTFNFEEGTVLLCMSNNECTSQSYWRVVADVPDDLMHLTLNNGKTAEYIIVDDVINVASLGLKPGEPIAEKLNWLISNNYKRLHVPSGIYPVEEPIVVNSYCEITGDGNELTLFNIKNTDCFQVNGNYVKLADFEIRDLSASVSPDTVQSTGINAIFSNHCIYERIHIENCRFGMAITGENFIWNTFKNCDFYGCTLHGFYVSNAATFFNDNSFYSCIFSNNVGTGLFIDVSDGRDWANTFYSCNIENNCQDRFGITSGYKYAVYNTSVISFIGCYFEANNPNRTTTDDYHTVANYDVVSFIGCTFTFEKRLVRNYIDKAHASFISCDHYSDSFPLTLFAGSGKFTTLGCNFNPGGLGTLNVNNLDINKKFMKDNVLDGNYPVCRCSVATLSSMTNMQEGQIIYIVANSSNVTLSNLVWGQASYVIPYLTGKAFICISGMLMPL